jgi:predicted RND superfamily exporter protein
MANPVLSLSAVLVLAAAALIPATRLKLNPDLGALLPEGSASTVRLEHATDRIGGTDLFAVTAEGINADLNLKAMDYLAGRMKSWDECLWVAVGRRFDRLEKKVLLYVPAKNIREIRDAVQEQIEYETCARSPLCVNLEDKNPPDFKSLFEKAMAESVFDEMGAEELKRGFLDPGHDPDRGRFMSKDGKVAALLARLSEPATNIDFAKMIRRRVDGAVEDMPQELRDKVTVNVRGAYDATREYEIIKKESAVVSVISLAIMFFLTLLFFNQKRSIVIVLAPLVIGAVLSLGFASIVYGELNSITAFIVAILLGMGIDYAIHIQRRFTEEAARRPDEAAAMLAGIRVIFRPLLVAAATTICALLTLRFAHFRGFKEYGTIAAVGIVFCFVTAIATIPPLNALFSRVRRVRPGRFVFDADADPNGPGMEGENGVPRRSHRLAAAVVVIVVIGASVLILPYGANVAFETDFKKFRAPGIGQLEELEKAIGTGRANPLIILGNSEAQMRRIHEQLGQKFRDQKEGYTEKLVTGFLTIASVIPAAKQQAERLGEVRKLEAVLETKVLDHVKGDSRRKIDKLRELASVRDPIVFDDLPFWARNLLRERNGSVGRIGYVYPAIDRWSAREVAWLRAEYDVLRDGGREVEVASSSFVFLDVVSVVKDDAVKVGVMASLIIFLILLVDLRSVVGALVCFATLGGAILWTLALMRLTGINIGVYNLLVLPTLMGVGIDSSVHLWHRWKQLGQRRIRYIMSSTGMAIVVALLTTAAGFSGLLVSIHPGLRSIVYFALPGIGLIILFSFVLMPAVFVLTRRR